MLSAKPRGYYKCICHRHKALNPVQLSVENVRKTVSGACSSSALPAQFVNIPAIPQAGSFAVAQDACARRPEQRGPRARRFFVKNRVANAVVLV